MKLLKYFIKKKKLTDKQIIENIIDKNLSNIDVNKDYDSNFCVDSKDFKVPAYVYNMCLEISQFIEGSTVEDILSIDMYNCGASDYSSKMILHTLIYKESMDKKNNKLRRDKILEILS